MKAKEIPYRNFKNFNKDNFNQDLQNRLSAEYVKKYAPFEKNIYVPYIIETLRKSIMKRLYLEKVYCKKRTADSLMKFKKQKSYCSRFYKKRVQKILI